MMGESGGAAKITIKYPPGDLLFKDLANLHNDYRAFRWMTAERDKLGA
jgi:hypothetical protein